MDARITHNIENLLQSLYAITNAAIQDTGTAAQSLRQRLPCTLDKLQQAMCFDCHRAVFPGYQRL